MKMCIYCQKEYKGKNAIFNVKKHLNHCIYNPDGIPYHCNKCSKDFENRYAYIGHHKTCGKSVNKKSVNIRCIDLMRCKYCNFETYSIPKLGGHVSVCKLNPDYEKIKLKRIENGKVSRSHSQETKDKISASRKKYLLENPDKVPYLLNHSSKESYPEKYFTEVFKNEGIDVVKNFRIGLYQLDFSIPEKKIDIEVDGSQHYFDKKIVDSDIKRTKFLEENGWDVIRINWSHYSKLYLYEKELFVNKLKKYVECLTKIKPFIKMDLNPRYKGRKKAKCLCGSLKEIKSKACSKCTGILNRKVHRPPYDQILLDILNLGYCATGRKYGVSDNTIRKWIK